MFGETLLESSPASQRRKRWPLATAFLLETVIAGVAIVVPLLSAGVIPVVAHPPIFAPRLQPIQLASMPASAQPPAQTGGPRYGSMRIVTLPSVSNRLCVECVKSDSHESEPATMNVIGTGPGPAAPNLIGNAEPPSSAPAGPRRKRLSNPSEAMLLHKVDPVYPHLARVTGISGTVKLHAIIGKDGSIQSLSLISGHPILAAAALEAVQQWRYRPYFLNGRPLRWRPSLR